MNDALKRMVPRWLIKLALPQVMRREARRHGLSMEIRSDHIDLVKGATVLRVSSDHAVYLTDAMVSFDYYATAVVPLTIDGRNLIDFSTPRYHDVVGFEAFPILFPSLAEPIVTATQYMGFADLSEGMTVLDLGAYSGLTSILFSQAVGRTGTVVAVEADARNIACIRRNFANYRKFLDGSVQLCEGAVWDADGPLSFFPVVHTVWNGRVVSNPGASSCFRTVSGYHQEYTQTEVVVEALRLDTYCDGEGITAPDLLCVDAQGGALHGLRGLGRYLDAVRAVIIEIEHREVFIGGDLYPAVDTFLRHAGFDQAVVIEHDGWYNNYLYLRRTAGATFSG